MRVRFAPSPTGFLHLGGLRTAFFNFLLARSLPNGEFILRVEDTDQSRLVPDAVSKIIETLDWVGIKFDKGPHLSVDGDSYIQSKRLPIYHKYIDYLLDRKLAYKCYCPPRLAHGLPAKYDRRCRELQTQPQNVPFVVRLAANPGKRISFKDTNYGKICGDPIDDIVILKSDKFPTYHFASVVDDHDMRVDVVMRGQEWLPSTPTHLALYEAFQWRPPEFCHLPLLLNEDRTKLSKRQQAAHVDWYRRDMHCLPEALLNFVSFLGWTPSVKFGNREVLTVAELISAFDRRDLNKTDAVVDVNRLRWFNKQHFNKVQPYRLAQELVNACNGVSFEYAVEVINLMQSRVESIPQLLTDFPFLFTDPSVEHVHSAFIAALCDRLQSLTVFDKESIRETIDLLRSHDRQETAKNLKLLRHLLTGSPTGPPIAEIMSVLGKSTVLRRLCRSCVNQI